MTISLLDTSPQVCSFAAGTGTSYTAPASTGGVRTVCYLAVHEQTTTGRLNQFMALGGAPCTLAHSLVYHAPWSSSSTVYAELWTLDEVDIPTGAQTLSGTDYSGGALTCTGIVFTLEGDAAAQLTVLTDAQNPPEGGGSMPLNALQFSGAMDYIAAAMIGGSTSTHLSWTGASWLSSGNYQGNNYRATTAHNTAPASDQAVSIQWNNTNDTYSALLIAVGAREDGPLISTVSIDNIVNQGETGVVVATNGAFTETPTTLTIGGTSLAFTWSAPNATITQPLPLDLPAGDYWVVLSSPADGSVSRLASYAVTHPIASIDPGEYDSNSVYAGSGASFPAGTYDRQVSQFTSTTDGATLLGETFKSPYTGYNDAPLANDINDYLDVPEETEGQFSAVFEKLFPDGSTQQWTVTLTVSDGEIVVGSFIRSPVKDSVAMSITSDVVR